MTSEDADFRTAQFELKVLAKMTKCFAPSDARHGVCFALSMPRKHRKLDAFRLADELAIAVYFASADFPPHERYGLQSQLRRAAVSTPTNIVEGCARESEGDYLRFLYIALGSAREALYLMSVAKRLSLLETSPKPHAPSPYGSSINRCFAAAWTAARENGCVRYWPWRQVSF